MQNSETIVKKHKSTMQVFMMSLMGAMGGLFWGYFQSHYNTTSDIYVIMMDIEEDKQSTFNGVTTGMIQLGGIFGAVLSSQLVNRLSRRKAFLLIDMLSLLGVGIHCIKSVPLLFIGNFIGGMSMGLNSTFIGTYISEVSPIQVAGMMGSLVQYTISLGMIIVSVLGLFMPTTDTYIQDQKEDHFWLVIFIVPALFPLLRLFYFQFIQKIDTPYYYAQQKDNHNLQLSLQQIYLPEHIQEVADDITYSIQENSTDSQRISDIFKDPLIRRKTSIGVGLAFVMQVSGINAVMLYSNTIFKGGKDTPDAQQLAQILTLVNYFMLIVANAIAGGIVDRLGRKTILCYGQILLTILLTGMVVFGYSGYEPPQKYLVILFTFVFGLSQGPVIWLFIPEILSGKHLSIACSSVWVFATAVTVGVPIAFDSSLKQYGTFAIFAVGTFLFIFWEFYYLIETKNKSRTQIDAEFIQKMGIENDYNKIKEKN